ncbi:hypothetical protein OfM1_19140 [Lactovum odontotermitis]
MQDIEVNYTPAIIDIVGRAEFEQSINEIARKYKGYVVTAETVKLDKGERAKLNKLVKSISDRRIGIKREFNKPLSEFENWVNKATKPLTDAVSVIDKGIKEVEENMRQIQADVIRSELSILTDGTEINPRIFEEKIPGWCKVANFTDTLGIKKDLMDSLTYVVDNEKMRLAQIKSDSAIITGLAMDNGMPDTPYLSQLKQGQELNYILELMRRDIAVEKEKAEAKAKRAEELARQEKEFATRELEKSMGVGEPVKSEEAPVTPKKPLRYQLWFEFADAAEKDLFKSQLFEIGYDRDAQGVFKKM